MFGRFHTVPERNGQTDRQIDGRMDRIAKSISRVSVLTRDKNTAFKEWIRAFQYDMEWRAISPRQLSIT